MLDSPAPAEISNGTAAGRLSARGRVDIGARQRRQAALTLLRCVLTEEFPGRTAVVSSFGVESAVILSLVSEVDPATPVSLPGDRQAFPGDAGLSRQAGARLKLRDVRDIKPDSDRTRSPTIPRAISGRASTDACCGIRKVVPLSRALSGFDAWITGRKRDHGAERSQSAAGRGHRRPVQDQPSGRLVSRGDRRRISGPADLPVHPLVTRRLSLRRLRTLHAKDRGRRRCTRGTLVRHREDRMRHPSRTLVLGSYLVRHCV